MADAGTAAPTEAPANEAARASAKQAVEKYLTAVKAKKWDVARKLIHPKTLAFIADLKKRKGVEDHELAPWAKVKESYLVEFELGEPAATAHGAVSVPSTEQVFSVEDNGVEDGVKAEYLVIPLDGIWYVTDRRFGENVFPEASVAAAYKGYFQGDYVAPPPVPAEKTKKGKKKS